MYLYLSLFHTYVELEKVWKKKNIWSKQGDGYVCLKYFMYIYIFQHYYLMGESNILY